MLFTKRLIKFIRNSEHLSEMFEDFQTDDELIEELNGDPDFLETIIGEYKRRRWPKQKTIGCEPCVSLKQVDRVSRFGDEKMLVLCGWFDPAGGLKGECAYCSIPIGIHEMEIEHAIPKSRGGTEELSNLVPACPDCNREKGDRTPREYLKLEGLTNELIDAVMHEWNDRFKYRAYMQQNWSMRVSEHQRERLGLRERVVAQSCDHGTRT
jgi:5-methylcytosine-specific restriction endonuclease McrA